MVCERLNTTSTCRLCKRAGFGHQVVEEQAEFILLKPVAKQGAGRRTLVPRAHVRDLTELPAPQMAAVLAGLAWVSASLRRETGLTEVEIRIQPGDACQALGDNFLIEVLSPPGPPSPY